MSMLLAMWLAFGSTVRMAPHTDSAVQSDFYGLEGQAGDIAPSAYQYRADR